MFSAEKDKGATLNNTPIHSSNDDLINSLVTFGTGVNDLSQIDDVFDYAKKCFKAAIDVRRCGSAALDICHVACGRTGYFFEFRLSPWDYCAASLIALEAGAVMKSENFEDIDDYFKAQKIYAIANEKILSEVSKL